MNNRFLICTLMLALTLASCTRESSTWDNKEFPTDKYKSPDVRPGDNFFMYCNGNYWDNTDPGAENITGFCAEEPIELMKKHYNIQGMPGELSARYAINRKKWQDNSTTDVSAMESKLKKMVSIVETITGLDSFVDAIYEISQQGGSTPLTIDMDILNSHAYMLPEVNNTVIMRLNPDSLYPFYLRLGLDEVQIEQTRNCTLSLLYKIIPLLQQSQSGGESQVKMRLMERHATDHEATPETRATAEGSLTAKLCDRFGIDKNFIYVEKDAEQLYLLFENAEIEELKGIMRSVIAYDFLFENSRNVELYFNGIQDETQETDLLKNTEFLEAFLPQIDNHINYVYSYEWIRKYVSEESRTKVLDMCEEMRAAFRARIDNLDWMSGTTKAKAKEKLDAMMFEVARSSEWITSSLPSLSDATLLENIFELRAFKLNAIVSAIGESLKGKILSYAYLTEESFRADINNAVYFSGANCVCILPVYTMYPMFDSSLSDAYNYAVTGASTIGHEMTHGFDVAGSKYDLNGKYSNWWTASDKMEFEDRCQLLVCCHNNLELLPDEMPGVFSNGEQTLAENTADLGGFLIVYDAYMSHLSKAGYFGESLELQKKRFFEAFAEAWRAKYNATLIQEIFIEGKDGHSLAKERVNGTVMNVDEWYELYNVKWGDNLYLPSERRARIW